MEPEARALRGGGGTGGRRLRVCDTTARTQRRVRDAQRRDAATRNDHRREYRVASSRTKLVTSQGGWRPITLGEVAYVISGFAFSSRDFQSVGVPVIKISNIRVGDVDHSEFQRVDPTFL